jgi:Protein of unknown function (DUF1549)/Protein of unknown function (DUF1553)
MKKLRNWMPALAAVLFLSSGLRAQPGPSPAAKAPAAALDPAALAARIDQLIEARWAEKGVKPAPIADDAEFMRRIYLDLTGRIPYTMKVRDFLADKDPNKREKLIEDLLTEPGHARHMSTSWRNVILPVTNDQQSQFVQPFFKVWLDKQVQDNVPYDQMVRELLTVPVNGGQPQPGIGRLPGQANAGSPAAFYQANEFKAENLAAATSRVFLGVRLECAQCHDHPFAKWTRQQFWEYAAFFSGMRPQQVRPKQPVQQANDRGRKIAIPGTEKVVDAHFLDGSAPDWKGKDGVDSRLTLADWFVSAENPYFAQTAANRLWAHFFGLGINDPVDDEPSEENPCSHPELLALLTEQFVAHNFEVKYLLRAITLSKTYQRTSVVSDASQNEPRLFARMAVKGMTPEQLFDSLALATGYKESRGNPNVRFVGDFGPTNARAEFLQRFATQDKKTETQTSILQALAMMNGKFIGDATSISRSNALSGVLDFPYASNAERIEALYLAALSRLPRPTEASRMLEYVNSGGPRRDSSAALADVFWVLLNSSEFMLNH